MKLCINKLSICLVILFFGIQLNSQAQITVDYDMTPFDISQSLVGEGIEIYDPVVIAADSSYAYYESMDTELVGPMMNSQGLLITTGKAENAIGPNDETGLPVIEGTECITCDYYDNEFSGSPLIAAANSGLVNWDACHFEFKFVPQGDTVRFDYSFASEEYIEWVGSSFNDAFGFFVSGPGIGTDVNVALLPGTFTTVAINNVNHIDNTDFFYHNENPDGDGVQYDGFTINTFVEFPVESCEEYTIKLIVADGTDRMYDSGVFISELSSNPVTIETSTAEGTDYMIEGCNDGTVTFVNPFTVDDDTEVVFAIDGSAELDVDYTTVPDINAFYDGLSDTYTMTIPEGESSISFDIVPIVDGIEGSEWVTISLLEQYCDTLIFNSLVDFEIKDELPISLEPAFASICPNESVQLTAVDSTFGLATFFWDPETDLDDPLSLTPIASPGTTTTYTFNAVLGACENSMSTEITVTEFDFDFDVTPVNCTGENIGAIDATVTGGVEPYTYSWIGPGDFASNNQNISNLPVGTYCLTVTDDTGCESTACVTVEEDNVLTIVTDSISDYDCGNVSCNGFSDGFIEVTATGGTGFYTYEWSTTDDTDDIYGLSAGSYTLTVTDESGCETSASYTLTEPDELNVSLVSQTDLLCTGTTTGEIEVMATGGCPLYAYNWSHDPILDAPLATNLATGDYTVTVTDANGCESVDSVNVVINPPIDPLTVSLDAVSTYGGGYNVSCPDASDGSIDVTISGGLPGYTFEWTDGNGTTYPDEDLSGLPCGTYTLDVTDANDCEFTLVVNLTCVPQIEITFTTVQNPCNDPDAGQGEIHITSVSGGNGGPYTTSWVSGPSCPCVGDDLTGLNSGDYVYQVVDGQGCVEEFTINIGENDEFTVTETIYDESCFGECDGAIDLEISQAVDAITWFNDEGFSAFTDSIANLCAGDYSVTVESGECVQTFSYTVSSPPEITIDIIQQIDPSCIGQNDGIIEIAIGGGTGNLTVNWLPNDDCDFSGSSDLLLENLFACSYVVEVTDEAGCTVSQIITLNAVEVMDIFVQLSPEIGGFNVACNGDSDANIDVTVSGGTPDCDLFDPYCYLYDWSEGADITLFGNDPNSNNIVVGAGTYVVNVTDANGCLATTTIDITEPDAIASNPITNDVVCAGEENGSINPNVTGGTGVYVEWEWTGDIGANASDADSLVGLAPGDYELYVEDSNGCSETFFYTISESPEIIIELVDVQPVTCFGVNDGVISVSVSGGTGVVDLTWTGPNNPVGNPITGLEPGTYIATATDELGCSTSLVVILEETEEMSLELYLDSELDSTLFDLPCRGDSIAVMFADVIGGTPDYIYTWEDCEGNFISNDTFLDELPAGCYSLSVEDANGCIVTESLDVTEPDEFFEVTSDIMVYPNGLNISCYDAMDGAIDLTVTGGVPDYTFLWELNSEEFGFSEDVIDLDEGFYEVLVVDDNGCDTLISFQIVQPPEMLINASLTTFIGGANVSCPEACDGSVTIDPEGGFTPYEISVDGLLTTDTEFTDLCAGLFVIEMIDSTGCIVTDSLNLIEPDSIQLSAIVNDITCFGLDNGSIDVTVTGGSGNYTYDWSPNGEDTEDLSDLGPDTYCLDILDENDCPASDCWDIIEPEELTASAVVTDATCGDCNGEIDVTASGGVNPLTYSWGTEDQVDLCPDVYTVTITDANDCEISLTEVVDGPEPLQLDLNISDVLCAGDSSGVVELTLSGGEDPFNITWLDSEDNVLGNDELLENLSGGEYTAVVNWSEGCEDEISGIVFEPDPLEINGFAPTDEYGFHITTVGGSDGSIETDVEGGIPQYEYIWDGPMDIEDGTENPEDLIAGEYLLTVTDANGCVTDSLFILIDVPPLTLPTGMTPNGDGVNDNFFILGLHLYPDNTFKVFNRWGNIVYEQNNYDNLWNGQNNDGEDLPNGTYFILFEAGDISLNGFVDLRR